MFDVYLNEKRDRLLVVPKGQPIPIIGNSGRWRKKKELSLLATRSSWPCKEMASIGADVLNIEGATRCKVSQLRRLPPRPRSRNDIGNYQAEARSGASDLSPTTHHPRAGLLQSTRKHQTIVRRFAALVISTPSAQRRWFL